MITTRRMSLRYRVAWWIVRAASRLFFRWRVVHPERVPMDGPVLLAANHASFADPPLVAAAVPRSIRILARSTLFDIPIFGSFIRSLNALPVDRDGGGAAGIKSVLDVLAAGDAILLFPEGTRTRTGQLQEARAGIGLAVIKSGAPVVPVRLWGTHEAWGPHHLFPRPYHVFIKFAHPIDFSALRAEARVCGKQRLKEIYQECADRVMDELHCMEPCKDVSTFGS